MDEKNLTHASVARRLEAAIDEARLADSPLFALTAKPSPDAYFRTLFAGNDSPLVQTFNKPPALRHAGFSLEHDGNSRIVTGDLRRAVIPGWKILELWRDGTLIYAVDALVQPFWATPEGSLQVNPLALVEPIYLFVELSRLIFRESAQKLKSVEYRVQLDRLVQNGTRASLSEGPLRPSFRVGGVERGRESAPDSRMERSVTWDGAIDPGEVAYELTQEVYHWFGISDAGIPYTKQGSAAIDPEALRTAGAN